MTNEEKEEVEDVLVALALCFLQDPQKYDTEINQKILGSHGPARNGRLPVTEENEGSNPSGTAT